MKIFGQKARYFYPSFNEIDKKYTRVLLWFLVQTKNVCRKIIFAMYEMIITIANSKKILQFKDW